MTHNNASHTDQTPQTFSELKTTRRHLLKVSGIGLGGLTLGVALPGCSTLLQRDIGDEGEWQANAWLAIHADNSVTFTLDRVEMGQGALTGLATLLAEELEYPPERIKIEFAGADAAYRNPEYGMQITGGSNSLATSWQPLRETGATAREMLIAAAAEVMNVPANYLHAQEGKVFHSSSGKFIEYGKLASLAAKQSIPKDVSLKSPKDFKFIGKAGKRLDSRAKVMGQAGFGIDSKLDGMLHAVIARSPYVGGRLLKHNGDELLKKNGVEGVVEVRTGLAIVAQSHWQAKKALESLSAEWQHGEGVAKSTEDVFALYHDRAKEDEGEFVRDDGDVEDAIESAAKVLEFEYELPFLAHATMEPMNCVANVQDSRADIWTSTQGPDVAQVAVAKVTDLSLDEVHIHNQFIGGGFGRRLSQDYVAEAAEISYKLGKPIKLVWSREDDMQNDFYRPASYHRLKAGLDDNNRLVGWDHQIVCPKIMDWYVWDAAPAMFPWAPKFMYPTLGKVGLMTEGTPLTPADRSPYEGADDLPYGIPSLRVRHTKADAGIPVSFWRSVGHSHNAFVTECFLDEIAHEAGQDSYAFKRSLLADSPRMQGVLDLAAKKGAWGRALPEGVYQGIAVHKSFGSYVGQVIELSLEYGQIRVQKVVCAIDCGVVVNPDIVEAQMESCIIFGLTAALYGDIAIEDGRIKQSNFHDYQLLRMNEAPEIEVHIVESQEPPTGVGEPGLPPLAPAIAQALFAATGKRMRQMPFRLS